LRELESIICAYPSQAWTQDFIIGRLWMIGSMLYCNGMSFYYVGIDRRLRLDP
jgi:hypothetical protein